MRGNLGVAVTVAMLLHATAASAQTSDTPSLSFNGFGTAGLVHSNEGRADFTRSQLVPTGAGHTSDWSAAVDSRLGLQLTADLTPRLSGIVQVIVEQRYDDTYTPTLEWANVKFDITPDLSVRAGRVVLPAFLVSEYRKVGYVIPWVRPPQEVYRLVPVTNTDGIDFSYRFRFDGFINTLQGIYGNQDTKLPERGEVGGEVKVRDALTIANTLEWGAATLFASYLTSRLTMESLNPLFDAFRQFGPEGEAIADRYDVHDKRSETLSIGGRYDPGDWFVMGEWARFESRTFLADSRGWYITGGYRLGSVTPYVTLARIQVDSNTSDPGLRLMGLPQPQAVQVEGLNAALNGLLGTGAAQKSISVGARWDFARNVALKAQFDHLDLDAGSPGVLINEQPDFRRGGTVSLFSATIDFVF